ncbi:MAG: molybdopterin-binding oxidoreductase, partial [Kribbellaceae bacterium]|nr:molybdopterin-binding oxidoreductase [Kribbellaceae bacterium]
MTKTRAALAGITAALVAVGLAELVAVFTGPRSAPLVAVDGWVIDHVPEWLKQFAISVFGTKDKLALLTGTAVVLLLIAAAIGLLARRSVALGVLGISLFALVGAVAAGTREGATLAWVLPSVVGGAAAALTLYLLVRTEQRPESESGDRRTFLKLAGLTAAGAVVAGLAGRALADRRGVAEARSRVELPAPAGSPAPAPSTLPSGYVTTNREFYRIDTSLIVPQVDPDTWRLRIHGA